MRIDGIIRKYGDRFENGSSEGWTVGSFGFFKLNFYLLFFLKKFKAFIN
jgi:hypothetical protein